MMKTFKILKRSKGEEKGHFENYEYQVAGEADTVATALTKINETEYVGWECNCLQKKCGACAMVIDGLPGLACSAKLSSYGDVITLEPLKKFPVVEDLIIDRSAMHENLDAMQMWFEDKAKGSGFTMDNAYEASRCLQCGCCLEVCPNFMVGGEFNGMASAVPASRIIGQIEKTAPGEIRKMYKRHVFEGCGKSLACRNICPAGIDIENLLINSNAIAIWKRFGRKGRKGSK
ncbi:MAG: succinate dehydrogenase/fumarate reductase iron-sulfur subunit [Firmicutes bacterium]|nr:succinate dehydrogenase/fumarate reductase iron-sulfur subunit [Bacillota bacterium]MBQ9707620.1 succinate dehydrogenase/fumarate reductase iron-sulfur subunit [Bacillota bacterium]